MASGGGEVATVDVRIHPLVIMAIADHYTMEKEQKKGRNRSVGLLFGKQEGRIVTVLDAFDMPGIDKKELEQFEKSDLNNFKQIYPDYEFVGWYSTGSVVRPEDQEIHENVTKDVEGKEADWRSERPLFLLLDVDAKEDQRDLPLHIFEQVLHVAAGKKTSKFVSSPYKLVSDEGERVTVVHCANVITGDEGKEQSLVVTPYASLKKAIQALQERLRLLVKFLVDVQAGKIPEDQKILRQLKALCNRLPTMDSEIFKEDFFSEYNDALVTTYLATITQSHTLINELVDKYNLVSSVRGKGRVASAAAGGLGGHLGPMGMGPIDVGFGPGWG